MSSRLPALATALALTAPVAAEPIDYSRQIKPLLKDHCYSCHSALKQQAKLRLDTVASITKGGKSGPAIKPGDLAASLLLERVADEDDSSRMPPEGKPLTADQIALLKQWISEGAKGYADEKAEEDPRAHWAFRKPVRPPGPPASDPAWDANPIDRFLADEHAKRKLWPVEEADKATLLRRVFLDLIGLPPTRDEVHAFLSDPSPTAYETVVDRLLASPQYGERWPGTGWTSGATPTGTAAGPSRTCSTATAR